MRIPRWSFALLLAIAVLLPTSAKAQTYTAVSGTVLDPNGLPYSGALITFSLTAHSGQATITPCVVSPCPVHVPGTAQADATGKFTVTLLANGSMLPAGIQWTIGVTEPGVPLPWGTGPQQFTYTFTASGSSMDLSAAMSALAPALTQQGYQPPPGPYPGPVFPIGLYGAKADMRTCTVSVTNTSHTLTAAGANPCAFQTTDVTKISWVMNSSSGTPLCGKTALTTITAQTGSTATISTACTGTLATTAIAYIGTDNWTPINKACAAVATNNKGTVYAAYGNYAFGGNGTSATLMCNIPNTVTGSVGFVGDGQQSTIFFPAPWIKAPASGTAFLFGFENDAPAYLSQWQLNGYDLTSKGGSLDFLVDVQQPFIDSISLQQLNWASGALLGFDPQSAQPLSTHIDYSTFCISTALGLSAPFSISLGNGYQGETVHIEMRGNTVCGGAQEGLNIEAGTGSTVNIYGGYFYANNDAFPDLIYIKSDVSGPNQVQIFGSTICSNGFSPNVAMIENDAQAVLEGLNFDGNGCPAAGPNVTDILNDSGATLRLSGSTMAANGTGYNISNAGSLFDDCGNFAAGGTGPLTNTGGLFGSCSATGTLQTASNITPSTGWGTSGAAGNGVSAVSGDSHAEYFTVTAAGTPTANPKIAIVFPTSFWQAAHCQANEISSTGTNGFSDTIQSTLPTATGVTLTWEGTPVSGSTYTFVLMCQ